MSSDEEETLEDYLHKNISKDAEAFIYEREHPIISKETLKYYFGDVAFIQYMNFWTKGQWNVVLLNDYCTDEDSLKATLNTYCGLHLDERQGSLVRFGYLRCLFSETFNPFQETMKRLLELNPIKKWLRKTIDNKEKSKLVACFLNGQLIEII